MKGIPCIWRVNGELCALYGLPQEVPASLRERMERAQQKRSEQQSRRTSRTEQDFVQLDAGEIEDDDDEDYEESMSGRVMERKVRPVTYISNLRFLKPSLQPALSSVTEQCCGMDSNCYWCT